MTERRNPKLRALVPAMRKTLQSLVMLIVLVPVIQAQAQTQALQVHIYTPQEIHEAGALLLQRHPESIEFLKSIDGRTPLAMPAKNQSAYDYMLALYERFKEKSGEAESGKKNTEEASKAVLQLQENHPDFAQCAPTIVKLLPAFPQRTGETLPVYLERLYRMAKEE